MNKTLSRKKFFLGLIIVAVLVGSSVFYKKYSERPLPSTEATQETKPKINLDPPTEQEISETEAHKEKLSKENQPVAVNTNTYGKTKVTPVITSANQNEVRSFVSGIVEEGGTCTATFRQGSLSFTKQVSGFGNVNTTVCDVIQVNRSNFAASGEWTVTLEYSSNNSAGTSEQSNFGVE